jgi:hypothetical protein
MKKPSLNIGTGLDRHAGRKHPTIQPAGDNNFARDNVALKVAPRANDHLEGGDSAAHHAQNHQVAVYFEDAIHRYARTQDGRRHFGHLHCPTSGALNFSTTSQ